MWDGITDGARRYQPGRQNSRSEILHFGRHRKNDAIGDGREPLCRGVGIAPTSLAQNFFRDAEFIVTRFSHHSRVAICYAAISTSRPGQAVSRLGMVVSR